MEIKRDLYLNKLVARKHNKLIKVITGIRRCGKSYLLNNLFCRHLQEQGVDEKHIVKLALDSVANEHLHDPLALYNWVTSQMSDSGDYYILLDEIQLVNNFVGVLNGLLQLPNADIYVTGSNSRFLSSDIVTEFRGRGDEVRVYPLSFAEFCSVYDGDKASAWRDYYTYGGLPLVLLQQSDEAKESYLKGQLANVYINDIVQRNNVQNLPQLNVLTEIVASNIGSLTNPLKLSHSFKSMANSSISDKTIATYLGYMEDAFLVQKSRRYDVKGKKYLSSPSKYYFVDLGLRNAALNFRQQEEPHLMENAIYVELLRRGFSVDVGIVTRGDSSDQRAAEVDFVANRGSKRYYVQSAYSMPTAEKEEQEKRSLTGIKDFFKRMIVVGDYIKPKRDESGIVTMSVLDFLLNEDSLDF